MPSVGASVSTRMKMARLSLVVAANAGPAPCLTSKLWAFEP